MQSEQTHAIQPGGRAFDKYQQAVPGEETKPLVVLDVHLDARADQYPVGEHDTPLSTIASNWPPISWDVALPDSYEPDADAVVEVVFYESLDNTFLGAWVEWSPEKIKRMCAVNDVTVYAYHLERLAPITTPHEFF